MNNKLCAMLIALFSFAVSATGFNEADRLYENKQFSQAFQAYKNLAAIGDTFSQYQLGMMYFYGEGVEVDYTKAAAWMLVSEHNAPNQGAGAQAQAIIKELEKRGMATDAIQAETDKLLNQYGIKAVNNKFSPVPLSDLKCDYQPSKWIARTAPPYPKKAVEFGLSGSVKLRYNVSSQGYVRDVEIIGSTDQKFIRNTLRVMPKWQKQPSNQKGLQLEGHQVQIQYNWKNAEVDEEELKKFVDEFEQKAKSGDVRAQYQLAQAIIFWQDQLKSFGIELSNFQDANKWNHEAAKGGHPFARYELGKNMIQGKGCEKDFEGGLAWLRASAIAGYAPAQGELAQQLLKKPDADLTEIVQLLQNASAGGHYLSSVNLAWLLSTHPDAELRNGKQALAALAEKSGTYYDKVRVLETQAAAYAALNDFDEAVDYQEDAIDQAEDYGWEIPVMQQRLASYQAKKQWSGEYYQ